MPDQDLSKRDWLGILKKSGIFIIILAVFLFLLWTGLSKYGEWSLDRNIKKIIENENRPYLEDTYGGKTPKETLELFIAAVEKEDFDLASKYFILSKQGEWKGGLAKAKEKNTLNWLLDKLKRMENIGAINPDNFQMGAKNEEGIFMVFVNFVKYPQGIWKIKEI